ncbi:CPCC family cysteine-rich protein [Actinoplanes sp. NPDC051470]|uniref:CPCC family cysteine-rich protein n=1 Tax=Actinoplanes sp. NPDC051470 TaxID=3157224 RepID=UPI0034129A5A
MGSASQFPCVCCGHLVLEEPPGSHQICPVCDWEDDLVQLRWPTLGSGANKDSLVESQRKFDQPVRRGLEGRLKELGFRPVDLETDNFENLNDQATPWPQDGTVLFLVEANLLAAGFEAPIDDGVAVRRMQLM